MSDLWYYAEGDTTNAPLYAIVKVRQQRQKQDDQIVVVRNNRDT
jgi:hypothetical protein